MSRSGPREYLTNSAGDRLVSSASSASDSQVRRSTPQTYPRLLPSIGFAREQASVIFPLWRRPFAWQTASVRAKGEEPNASKITTGHACRSSGVRELARADVAA